MKSKGRVLLGPIPILLLCCFIGCSQEKSESASKNGTAANQAVKTVQEKLDAEETVTVGYAVNTLNDGGLHSEKSVGIGC